MRAIIHRVFLERERGKGDRERERAGKRQKELVIKNRSLLFGVMCVYVCMYE